MDGGTGKRENKGGVPQDPGFLTTGHGIPLRGNPGGAPGNIDLTEDVLHFEGALASASIRQRSVCTASSREAVTGKHTERLRLFLESDGLPQLPLTESVRTEGGGHPPGRLQDYHRYIAHEQTSRTGQRNKCG